MQKTNDQKEMREFLIRLDKLCFEYGYKIEPTTLRHDILGRAILGLKIGTEGCSKKVLHVDGDGGFELPLDK